MKDQTREFIINKLGTLMLANAELAAENLTLAKRESEHLKHIGMLKAELARWQEAANQKKAERAAVVGGLFKAPLDCEEGDESNGACHNRPDGESVQANPYEDGGKGR